MAYIKADLFRFFKKKSFLVLIVLFTLAYTFFFNMFKADAQDVIIFSNILIAMSPVLIGIALFVMVYTDDLTAHSTQIAIGYGIPRFQIVISKMIEMAIIYLLVLGYGFALASVLNIALSVNADLSVLFKYIPALIIGLLVNTLIAGFFSFVFQKSSIAIIVFVVLVSHVLDSLLELIVSLKWIAKIAPNASMYLPANLINDIGVSGMRLNNAGIMLLYGTIALILTIVLFNKTELDF